MQFDPGEDVVRIEQRLARRDTRHVDADIGHALRKRAPGLGVLDREIGGAELPEQGARSHISPAEAGAFLAAQAIDLDRPARHRSEEHTSELQSLMRISYAVFCLKKKKQTYQQPTTSD